GPRADDADVGFEQLGHAGPSRGYREFSAWDPASACRHQIRLASTGTSASRPRPTNAPTRVGVRRLAGSKLIRQSPPAAARQVSYVASCAAITLSRPAPKKAKMKVAGMIPSAVAATN